MSSAKDIVLKPITAQEANELVRRVHYSGKVVQNSQLHIGVYYNGELEGAMQFGTSLDKRSIQRLVSGTGWHEFIELNRMAFTDVLLESGEAKPMSGYQLRYIYFIDPTYREKLTVPELPYSEIERRGAGMYKGQPRGRGEIDNAPQSNEETGGASPTRPLLNDDVAICEAM